MHTIAAPADPLAWKGFQKDTFITIERLDSKVFPTSEIGRKATILPRYLPASHLPEEFLSKRVWVNGPYDTWVDLVSDFPDPTFDIDRLIWQISK